MGVKSCMDGCFAVNYEYTLGLFCCKWLSSIVEKEDILLTSSSQDGCLVLINEITCVSSVCELQVQL